MALQSIVSFLSGVLWCVFALNFEIIFYFCFIVLCFYVHILGLDLNLCNAHVLAFIYSIEKK